MKNIINKIKNKFARKQPVYGKMIFVQRDWLSKQVDEAIWKRSFQLD